MSCVQNCCTGPETQTPNSGLMTPEPHHIPGYLGYIPQEKYRYGHTYGISSHRILMDPCVDQSCRTILSATNPECAEEFGRPGISRDAFLQAKMGRVDMSQVRGPERYQYKPYTRQAYTGSVPRFQTILGHTHSPACTLALTRFQEDQWRDRVFHKELESLDNWRFCYKTKPWEAMERPSVQDYTRPPPCDVDCFHKSIDKCSQDQTLSANICIGESSLPCACGDWRGGLIIKPQILTPDKSVCEYGERRLWGLATESMLNKPCLVNRTLENNFWTNAHAFIKPSPRKKIIYRNCESLKPLYAGHVPGHKFRFGKTFGESTKDAKRYLDPTFNSPFCFPLPIKD